MVTKLDRFAEALQSRSPDNALIDFFNDVYDESENNERYIAELELVQLGHEIRAVTTIEILAQSHRVRKGAANNLRELQRIRI